MLPSPKQVLVMTMAFFTLVILLMSMYKDAIRAILENVYVY